MTPFITPERAESIATSDGEFPCHKTTQFDYEGTIQTTNKEVHCAGFLIMREKMERPSQMMRICERLGMYNRKELDMEAPVYESALEMVEAHEDAMV